jgi:hypothetical protein
MFRSFLSETKWLLITILTITAVLLGNIFYFTWQQNKLEADTAGIPDQVWNPELNVASVDPPGLEFKQVAPKLYTLTGTVRVGDCEKIVPLMPTTEPFAVILESPGGSLFDGGCIASHFKARNVVTVVRDTPVIDEEGNVIYEPGLIDEDDVNNGKVVCASSCSLMFLGGDRRYLIGDVYFGIHAPRTPSEALGGITKNALEADAYRTSAALINLLAHLGMTNEKLRLLFIQVPSASMYWLNPADWEDFPELQLLATHYLNFHGYSGVNVIAVGTE